MARTKKKTAPEEDGQLSFLSAITGINHTEEQKDFIYYDGSSSIALIATAGAGKTAVCVDRLEELIKRGVPPDKIIFFSYTKAATEELQKRVGRDDVKITTIHAFALGILAKVGKFKKIIIFHDFIKWYKDKFKPSKEASHETKTEFYQLIGNLYDEADYISSEISAFKLQTADDIKCHPPLLYGQYKDFLRETKSRDFADMLIEVRDLLKEDKWLKMFRGKYDYIFIDEYQDTSAIQLQILLALNAKYYYLIGDPNQCVIEGTKIHSENGIKKIEEIKIGDKVLTGKGSGTLGYKPVTNIFKNKFLGEVIKIKTKSGKELITTKEHTHLAKYVINEQELFFTYLMYKEGYGFRIGCTRSYHNNSSFDNCTRFGFMNRLVAEHAQKIWILEVCESESMSRFNETKYSLKYGIPTIVFLSRGRDKISNQDYIDMVFKNIDTETGGFQLLSDKNFDFKMSHHFPKSIDSKSNYRNINLCLCHDGRGANSIHNLEIGGKLDSDKERLINAGFNVQDNGKHTGWRIRKQSSDFEDLVKIKDNFLSIFDGHENRTVLLKKGNSLNFTKASYLLKGMTIYFLNENNEIDYDIIETVERQKYDGYVYDINVENTHNFVANGIFTHNSIYGYSGANCRKIEAMLKSRRETIEKNLTINFRSDKCIIDNSNRFSALKAMPNSKEEGFVKKYIIFQIDAPKDENGNKKTTDLLTVLDSYSEVAILARTNAVIKDIEFELLKKKYPMKYFNYITNSDFVEYKKGEAHASLQDKLNRIKSYFNNSEMEVFTFIEANKSSRKFVTSIHKSKGREFDYCVVVNSIDPELIAEIGLDKALSEKQLAKITFDPNDEDDVEPRNIHYVAVSRSKHGLFYMLYNF